MNTIYTKELAKITIVLLCLESYLLNVEAISLENNGKTGQKSQINKRQVANETNDPCSPYEPQTPNFTGHNRRISQIKCYEYLWQIKYRDEKAKRDKACKESRPRYGVRGAAFAIGGRDTQAGEFPHMAAIGWSAVEGNWIFKCGGSLISNKFVLTAAHCSRASPRDTTISDIVPKIVRIGDKNILGQRIYGKNPRDRDIVDIIQHPDYAPPKKYDDIALLEINEVVTFTKFLQPACLWTEFDVSALGSKATLTGWGVVDVVSAKTSPELQAADVDLIESETCDYLLRPSCNRNWCGVRDSQLCAGKLAGGVDSCQGDSGGPLQVRIALPPNTDGVMHFLIGVTSFGMGCARADTPGIYTRVSSYVDWIENVVWPQSS